jgi:NgoPII restriction endonuclease
MANLLTAIKTLIDNPITTLAQYAGSQNRANATGESLENYVMNVFSDSFGLNVQERMVQVSQTFSYAGNQHNPPDLILHLGDAIEIKKVQLPLQVLALNSSFPKAKLYADSPMITSACRNCEVWHEKDIVYVVGHVVNQELRYIWLVYGDCFVADKSIYEKIKSAISLGIKEIPDIEFTETAELGKVKKIDPLGVTDLRIRGMWHIDNPHKIFDYLRQPSDAKLEIFCLMQESKFNSFPVQDRQGLESLKKKHYSFEKRKITNPNNTSQNLDTIFITFKVVA